MVKGANVIFDYFDYAEVTTGRVGLAGRCLDRCGTGSAGMQK
jgi:hypothetical protein